MAFVLSPCGIFGCGGDRIGRCDVIRDRAVKSLVLCSSSSIPSDAEKTEAKVERRVALGLPVSATALDRRVVSAARKGDAARAEKWVEVMRARDYLIGTVTYTSLIHAYRKAGDGDKCLQLLKRMVTEGTPVNENTTSEVVRVCVETRAADLAMKALSYIVDSKLPLSRRSWNAFLKLQLKENRIDCAETIVQTMRALLFNGQGSAGPDIITYNILISEYSRQGQYEKALATFGGLLSRRGETSSTPDVVTFNSILDALCRDSCTPRVYRQRTINIVRIMKTYKIKYDVRTATALVRLSGLGDGTKVWNVYEGFKTSQLFNVDRRFYEAAIEACGRRGHVAESRRIITEMTQSSFRPSVYSFNLALAGCAKLGKGADGEALALEILQDMRSCGVKPDKYSFCSLLSSKAMRSSEEVIQVLQKAAEQNIVLSDVVASAAISSMYDDVDGARRVWLFIRSKSSSPPGRLCCLSFLRVCGTAGRPDLAVRLVYAMQKEKIQADPECYLTYQTGLRKFGGRRRSLQPYDLILRTLCAFVDDMDLPITRIRIKY